MQTSQAELSQYIRSYFGVPEKDLLKIGELFEEDHMERGDFFAKEGTPCGRLSFIRSGLIRVFKQTEDKEVTQWISTPGYFIADISSLVFDTPARWNIQALTEVELFSISHQNYNQIGSLVPQWHILEKIFLTKCFITLEDRVFTFLSMNAEERYLAFFEQNKELFTQVPLQYIASLLGMTPETFSRVRKKLSR